MEGWRVDDAAKKWRNDSPVLTAQVTELL